MYKIEALVPLSGDEICSPVAINSHGRAVGQSGNGHAVAWGRFQPYGLNSSVFSLDPVDLHPHLNANALTSEARDINDAGVIVGAWFDQHVHAFRYSLGVATELPSLREGTFCAANSINHDGHVVGMDYDPFSIADDAVLIKPVHWTPNLAPHDLGRLPSIEKQYPYIYYIVRAINNNGDVCGYAEYIDGNLRHAFGGNVAANLQLLAPAANIDNLYGYQYSANGINAAGRIVGKSNDNPAFWSNGQPPQVFSSVPGNAFGVNKYGQAVGTYLATSGNRAWYWDGVLHDLNDLIEPDSGWVLRSARDINNQGQIVGSGWFTDPNDPNAKPVRQGFRVTPPHEEINPHILKFEEWIVQHVITGQADGPIRTIPPKPVPVGPWNSDRYRIPLSLQNLVSAARIHLESQHLTNHEAQANIEGLAREILAKELEQLLKGLEDTNRLREID